MNTSGQQQQRVSAEQEPLLIPEAPSTSRFQDPEGKKPDVSIASSHSSFNSAMVGQQANSNSSGLKGNQLSDSERYREYAAHINLQPQQRTSVKTSGSSNNQLDKQGVFAIPPEEQPGCCAKTCWCLCCIPYYLCCCCLCCGKKKFKTNQPDFVRSFTRWLPNINDNQHQLGRDGTDDVDPIPGLIKLYSCDQSAMQELSICRINPNMRARMRRDLEFYIPQILSLFLQGYYPRQEDLIKFIVSASREFHFSHRVLFFIQSVLVENLDEGIRETQNQFINRIVQLLLKQVGKLDESLFIANSLDFQRLLPKFGLAEFYAFNKSKNQTFPAHVELQQMRMYKVQKVIDEYTEQGWVRKETSDLLSSPQMAGQEKKIQDDEETLGNMIPDEYLADIIQANDIIMPPFKNKITPRNLPFMGNQNSDQQISFDSYLSTPKFIKRLTEISDELIHEPDQMGYLKNRLKEVNKQLPAAVYLPFISDSLRNYAVLHIVADESRIFKTKERAPVMLSIEVYRPVELALLNPPSNMLNQSQRSNAQGSQYRSNQPADPNNDLLIVPTSESFKQRANTVQDQKNNDQGLISAQSNYPFANNTSAIDVQSQGKNGQKDLKRMQEEQKDVDLFLRVRQMTNKQAQAETFGMMADTQDSKPISIANLGLTRQATRQSTKDQVIEIKEQYFDDMRKHNTKSFAGSMNEQPNQNQNPSSQLIIEENYQPLPQQPGQAQPQQTQQQQSQSEGNIDFFTERGDKKIFLETSKETDQRVRANSPFQNLKTWRLIRVMVKANDDVRQEQFAMQLISQMDQIFQNSKCELWLKTYEIIATGQNCGLMEVVGDAMSIHGLKGKMGGNATLSDYFVRQFGGKKSARYKKALDNFCRSLAAYSLVCYILQVKDRHNGNIMIDIEGHIVHIDFGFLLSNAPGKGVKFETAPFKLTQEMFDLLGGQNSQTFDKFRQRMAAGFMALQANAEKIIILVEMMLMGQSDLGCFIGGRELIRNLKERLFPGGKRLDDADALRYVDGLIYESNNNWKTQCYDNFQYCVQGIL